MSSFEREELHMQQCQSKDEQLLLRTLEQLCNASSNEARSVAAAQLREAVELLCEDVSAPGIYGEDFVKYNPAITTLNNKLQSLLKSRRKEDRLAAVSAVRFLFHGETESMESRLRRAVNAFRVLFAKDVTDMYTARAAALLAADISLVNNTACDLAVTHLITTIINNTAGISNIPSTPEGRAVSAMVITELAKHAPSFVFRERSFVRPVLWGAVQDEARNVREEAVKALQAVIENIFERAPIDAAAATSDILSRMLLILQDTATSYFNSRNKVVDIISLEGAQSGKVHGALLMLSSLVRSSRTARGPVDHFSELCELILPLHRCSDKDVRQVVCRVIPSLAQLEKSAFVSKGFLENVHKATMRMGRCPEFSGEDKGLALEALGKIANEVGKDAFLPYLREVLLFCDLHLTPDIGDSVPQKYVIACLMYLANASHGSEEFQELMIGGLLEKVLQSEFTLVLVHAVCAIQSALPLLAEIIELRLVQIIATILRQGVVAALQRLSQQNMNSGGTDDGVMGRSIMMPKRNLIMSNGELENAEDAANVIDATFQPSKEVDYPPDYYPQNGSGRAISGTDHHSMGDGLYRASYGSSVDNYSYGARESFLHSYMANKIEFYAPAERVLDLSLRSDKANSPCVAMKAIELYTITKMQVGDITLFTSQFVLEYLENEIVKVRLLAVRSCAKLMDAAAQSWIEIQKGRGQSRGLRGDIQKILLKLVALAVTDPSRAVRRTALEMLDRDLFHPYLLEPPVLQNLFLCYYDECPKVRCLSVSLGGRLRQLNPAHVNISMRKLLEYLIEILRTEHHTLLRMRRECAVLLQLLISEARPLVDCYSEAVMEVLISRLKFARRVNDNEAAKTVLHAIGDLGGISSRVNLFSYCDRVVPVVVSYILDDHASDRQICKTAIHSLYKLVQCTGYVIQPYAKFQRLLPGLLQLLSNENDAGLRLEIETLIGCLGAVDPSNHKDAALPSLAGSTLSQSQAGGVRASRPSWTRTRTINPASLPNSIGQSYQLNLESTAGSLRNRSLGPKGSISSNPGFPVSVQYPAQLISLFGVGPEKLADLTSSYTPVWARQKCEEVSLVGLLEHPFTASKDYFPSIALDKIMSLIRMTNRKVQHREAFTAVVRILGFCQDRIPHFLHAIFPCILWVLRPEVSSETKPVVFSPFHEFVMARVAEIVALSGKHILPYVFDTVLLIHRYIQDTRFHPKCVIAGCKLLVRIQIAIGDVFRPIISTLLSSLLEALSQDYGRSGSMAEAVLRVLESFGSMLNSYSAIVLQMIVNVLESAKNYGLKESALRTLISILREVDLNEVASVVLHPLLRVLKYSRADEGSRGQLFAGQGTGDQRFFDYLADGAATAIAIIARRAPGAFRTFIPVVAKTLKSVPTEFTSDFGMQELKKLLLERDRRLVTQILNLSSDEVRKLSDSNPGYRDFPPRTNSDGSAHSLAGNLLPPVISHFAPGAPAMEAPELPIPEEEFMELWRIQDNFTASDWTRWRSELEVGLIRFSGSAALRACSFLFENFPFLARPLFNAAFLSCWTPPSIGDGLSDSARRTVVHILIRVLQSPTMPINLTQSILDLFEYMEHDERPLPASVEFLAETAFRCGAFAKALRYKEGEYAAIMRSDCSRAAQNALGGNIGLLAIYEKLGHDESAKGTQKHFESYSGTRLNEHVDGSDGPLEEYNAKFEQWAAKLGEWEIPDSSTRTREARDIVSNDERMEALQILREEPVNSPRWSFLLKKLKTQNDLGEWRSTNRLVKQAWDACEGNEVGRKKLAVDGRGVSVAFDLANWEEFEERLHYLSENPFLNAFYRTLLLVRRGRENPELLVEAERYLEEARKHLDVHLTARLSEGYPRAYLEVIHAQTLVELEEMIKYLRIPSAQKGFAQYRLQAVWDQRLAGCKYDDYIWYRLLMIRALVLPPLESKDRWIEFSCLCRKNGRLPLASEALRMLVLPSLAPSDAQRLSEVPVERMSTRVLCNIPDLDIRYAVCRHIWACSRQVEAFQILKDSVSEYKNAAYAWKSKEPIIYYLSSVEPEAQSDRKEVMVAAEVLLKLAKWSTRLVRRGVPDCGASETMALEFAKSASEMRANFDKPWHWWGSLNCERAYQSMGMSSKEGISHNLKQSVLNSEARQYLTNAIDGFFKSIKIGGKTKLEDSLKVLKLWFKFGSVARMYKAFDRGFEDTVITDWLEVVPQIIARLHTTNRNVQAGIEHLLTRIGNEHPQMVVYNLIVAKHTQGHVARKEAATRVLDSIKRKHPGIVTQAEMVARELVRVAVLWGELWYEKLEEASRLYFGKKDLNSMLQCILPMHKMIERGPETSYEKSFMDLFGRELLEAGRIIEAIADARQRKASFADLDAEASKLWQCYYFVFGRIQKQQHMMNVLDLSKVSQWLKHASNLELAVPGTYDPNAKEMVTLQSFGSMLRILQSKQRPRKLAVLGSDGRQYDFLLKGHEDLRQDERVMQVFGLINKILSHSQERSIRRGVDIKRYAVIPLSTNAGLIEWVPDCDTMHALVKEHREVRKVMPNIEHKVMTRVAPHPDRLPLLHKVDIFKFMLQNTSGSDIARVLWLKSRSSEKWLDRRTSYARSLASSSMAGYLLGLGDRHPSNLMMDRASGKIMHIDFGDCFEVAMVRDKYPEKVPFRLTRMLVKALEPCGVDGYFRHTCEAVMRELREPNNRESLLSMMEAFVHDPLLRMKLVGGEELQRIREEGNRQAAMNLVLHNAAPPMLSESLQLRLLTQEGSLRAAHAMQMQQEQVHVPVDLPVLGAIATGANPSNQNAIDSAFAKSPAMQSRRERDRLLKVLPRDKCIEVADERAAIALQRVEDKLYGRDFGDGREPLAVENQVKLLIDEATSVENLCSLFTGWCPFW